MLKNYEKYLLLLICLSYNFQMKPALMQQEKPSFLQTYRLPSIIGASSALAGAGYALRESDHFAPGLMWGGGTLVTTLLAKKLWDVSKQRSVANWEKSYKPIVAGALGGWGLGFVLAKIVQNRGWNPYILAAIAGAGASSFCNFKVRQMLEDVVDSNLVQSKPEIPIKVDQDQESKKVFVAGLPEDEPENMMDIDHWRRQARSTLFSILSDEQKEMLDRAYNIEQIREIIVSPELVQKVEIVPESLRYWLIWASAFYKTVPDSGQWLAMVKHDIKKKRDYWFSGVKVRNSLNVQDQEVFDFLLQLEDVSVFNNVLEGLRSYDVQNFVNAIRVTPGFQQWLESRTSPQGIAQRREQELAKLTGFLSEEQREKRKLISRAFSQQQIDAIVSGTLDQDTKYVLEGTTFENWYKWV